jgi:hypothetical protein
MLQAVATCYGPDFLRISQKRSTCLSRRRMLYSPTRVLEGAQEMLGVRTSMRYLTPLRSSL